MNIAMKNLGSSIQVLRKAAVLGVAATAFLVVTTSAQAQSVTNGGFESNGGNGQLGYNTAATDWSISGGYTFLYAPGTADTSGAPGVDGTVYLWGPNDGSANGLPATSPAGGYYIAQDSDFVSAAISQTINGLTVGGIYTVGFYEAAAQQNPYAGPTNDQWQVSLGGQTDLGPVMSIGSEGFSGWQYQTETFTATSTSETLSFLAVGTLANPPFALLDGVTLTAPEGGAPSMYLLLAGAVCFGAMFVIQRNKLGAGAK